MGDASSYSNNMSCGTDMPESSTSLYGQDDIPTHPEPGYAPEPISSGAVTSLLSGTTGVADVIRNQEDRA